MLEGIGVERATTVAIAMATFGLISGSLMGGLWLTVCWKISSAQHQGRYGRGQ